MNKYQEALKLLIPDFNNRSFLGIVVIEEAMNSLQELVDKATPKKVNGFKGDYSCSNCDSDRGIERNYKYCGICGTLLIWGNIDNE